MKNLVNKSNEFSDDFKNLLMYALSEYSLHILKSYLDLDAIQVCDILCHLSQNKYPTNLVVDVLDWIGRNVHYPSVNNFKLVNENK